MTGSADIIETYREMLKLDPPGSRVFVLFAEQLCASGQWEQAADICRQGLVHHPDNLRSRVLLGWALMEMGEADQSERVLLEAVEEVRKNAMIFKLLSEFAIFSGNAERAGEYARIYEAFEPSGAAGLSTPESPAAKKEPSDRDDFKAEAITELQGPEPDSDSVDTGKPSKMSLENILTHLTQRIEERFAGTATPLEVLSEEDRNFLKQEFNAALQAG